MTTYWWVWSYWIVLILEMLSDNWRYSMDNNGIPPSNTVQMQWDWRSPDVPHDIHHCCRWPQCWVSMLMDQKLACTIQQWNLVQTQFQWYKFRSVLEQQRKYHMSSNLMNHRRVGIVAGDAWIQIEEWRSASIVLGILEEMKRSKTPSVSNLIFTGPSSKGHSGWTSNDHLILTNF